jgi:hypothetical protein
MKEEYQQAKNEHQHQQPVVRILYSNAYTIVTIVQCVYVLREHVHNYHPQH